MPRKVDVNALLVSEVLKKVSNAKTKKEKIDLLQTYNTQALRSILIWNYDEEVKSMLPEGDVPYNPNEAPAGTEHTRLAKEYKGLFRFVKGGQDNLPVLKRESMFVQLLEGLHESEAEVICLVKDKKLQKKYRITKSVVQEAFPQIVWGKNRS
tara:strand:- start:2006 stop:2464 length:459 start_codon:yes stop_codon:yes gene_type:complete